MVTAPHQPAMLDLALDALHHGLAVVPPAEDGTKRPAGPWQTYQHRLPTEDEIRGWYANGRHGIGIVCGAVSGNLEMLEFEGRAMGEAVDERFAELADQAGIGDLVANVMAGYTEWTPSGGLHILYRVNGPIAGNTKLARRPASTAELEQQPDDRIKVLIETRGEGGYVIVAPTHGPVHPTAGEWRLVQGGFDSITTITPAQRDQLHRLARALDDMPATPAPTAASTHPALLDSNDRPGDLYNQQPDATTRTLQLLQQHGWQHVFDHPHAGHADHHLRRPGKNDGTSAVLHGDGGTLYVFSTSTAFTAEEPYTPFAVYTQLEHHGDYRAAARQLRPAGTHGSSDLSDLVINIDRATGEITATPAGQHLPDELWDTRPILQQIRQAARSRLVAPDAVLGAILTRIAACTPHTVELPAIIGTPVGLTFYAGIVGPPEAGKSAAAGVAAELLPAPKGVLDRLPVGSGEGMVDILFDYREEVDEDTGKKRKVKTQVAYAAIFHIDEGAVLAELSNRQGTTLLPTIRTAWSHGTLGNANASIERRRILDGRNYVYGITFGIQPEYAAPILADTAAGTPQRFVWFNATDPALPNHQPDWPGTLTWEPPTAGQLDPHTITRGGWRRHALNVHPDIAADIITHRRRALAGDGAQEADAHHMLVRLKIAALLAILDRRLCVDLDDWHLAHIIDTTSRTIRRATTHTLQMLEEYKQQASDARRAHTELVVEDTREQRALTTAARAIGNVVHNHHEEQRHVDPEGCARQCARDAVSGKHKKVIGVPDAIGEALHRGFIVDREGRLHPGDARPT
jgi:hypothetical protein